VLAAALACGGVAEAATAAKPEPTPAAIAARKADAARYADCMGKVDVNPKEAFDLADGWAAMGGGEPAKHCAAAALLKLGLASDAAERLEALAKSSAQEDDVRAHMLDQAGQAWATAKQWDRANAAQSAALDLAPDAVDLWVSRARTRAQALNYGLAVDDLNQALKRAPNNVEALVLRGSAYRFLDAHDLALADLDRAVKLDPADPSARLERGILHRLMKQPDLARTDWREALLSAPDDAPIVEDIRRNIELLEFPDTAAK
jgi:tetratricopeptide (TPR) repeat protein